jgi:hypothetical protein
MVELRVQPVDPRDERWEIWNPAYRVHFWRARDGGWARREIDVSGGDVMSVLRWAEAHASEEETYTVFATVESEAGLGLLRLVGDDPTRREGV